MGKIRKDTLFILKEIESVLVGNEAYTYQQLAKEIECHWMTIRNCCEYLISNGVIDGIKIKDRDTYLVRKKIKEVK